MNVALTHRPMTLDSFLAWEERQEPAYEFDGFRPRAMTGGTEAHALIQANILIAVGSRLRGTPCRAYGSHLKLRLANSVRYPDAMVICAPAVPKAKWTTAPTVIFEILSPSTAQTDLFVKSVEYQAAASLQRYVVLAQAHMAALVFARAGGSWPAFHLSGPDAVLRLPEIGIELPLAELYEGIDLVAGDLDDSEGHPP